MDLFEDGTGLAPASKVVLVGGSTIGVAVTGVAREFVGSSTWAVVMPGVGKGGEGRSPREEILGRSWRLGASALSDIDLTMTSQG